MNNLLNKTLAIIAALFFIILKAFSAGKNSQKNRENEKAVESIKKLNAIKDEISKLTDTELDSKVRKYTRKPKSK